MKILLNNFFLLAFSTLMCYTAQAQFSLPGQLDTTFNFGRPHSFFTDPANPQPGSSANGTILSIVQQTNGKLIIAGDFINYNGRFNNRIARLNVDGKTDTTLKTGNGANGVVNAVALQPDGKIIIVGNFTNYNANIRNRIVRLNADGSVDATFNIGTGTNGTVNSITLQPDGKIIIGGDFTTYNSFACRYIARINADGSHDATFSTNSGTNGSVKAIALQPDGKVLIGGDFTLYKGTSRSRIARLNTDASVDSTFNPGVGMSSTVSSIALQLDGKILLGGSFSTYNGISRSGIARLNQDASLDATFNPGTGANGAVLSIAIQSDGKVIIGGNFTSYNGTTGIRVIRINTDGSFDLTFNITPGGANDIVNSITIQPDGKVLIGGSFNAYNNLSRNRIVRTNPDGSDDVTFNPEIGPNSSVISLSLQPDGKILIAGSFTFFNKTSCNRIARLNADGSLDTTFNSGIGPNQPVSSVILQPDGKVLIGGRFTSYNGTPRNRIARLNEDGSLDASFNPGSGVSGSNPTVYSIVLQPDGKVLIGGDFTTYNGTVRNQIARLNTDGSLDVAFNPGSTANGDIYTIVLQPDGKVLIGGEFANYNGTLRNNIVRLNADGSIDATFFGSPNGSINSITLQPDGKVLIGGAFWQCSGSPRNRIARLHANGSLDLTFNPGSGPSGTAPIIYSIVVQPDGNLIIGGDFDGYNGTSCRGIARINSYGKIDDTFNTGIGTIGGRVNSVILQPDGKALFVGSFYIFSGVFRPRIARIFSPNCTTIVTNTTDNSSVCIGNTRTLTGTSGGTWNIALGTGSINDTIYTASGSGSVSIYNYVGGCTSPLVTFTISITSSPSIPNQASICPGNSATITPTSGGVSYRFYTTSTGGSPLPGGNGVISFTTPTLNSNTNYFVSSVSALGCESSNRTSIIVPVFIFFPGINGPTTVCLGSSVTLAATGGISYLWNNNETTASIVISPNQDTIYSVIVTGSGNCIDTLTQIINVINAPLATNTTDTSAVCFGKTKALTGTPGGIWRIFSGPGSINDTTFTASSNTGTVSIYNEVGACISSLVTFTVNPLPSRPSVFSPATICPGTSATITPTSGGASYRFYATQSGGSPLPGGNGVASFTTPPLNSNTTYYVSSVSAIGCESTLRSSVTVTVRVINAAINGSTTICPGLSTTLTASGGNSYVWSNNQTTAAITVSPTQTTIYTVTVTGTGNCTATASQTVSVVSAPTAIIFGGNIICNGESTQLFASGGNSYVWSNNETTANIVVSPTQNTTYTVTVSIGANCSATATKTINVYQPSSGSINRAICQGTSFLFNNQALTIGGIYRDTLINAVGCDSILSLNLTINDTATLNNSLIANASFSNVSDGAIDIDLAGNAPLSFNWSNGATTEDINNLFAGLYSVTVTDVNTCASVFSFLVSASGNNFSCSTPLQNPGFYPEDTSLPCIVRGQYYFQEIALKNFTSSISDVEWIELDSIAPAYNGGNAVPFTGLPNGINWVTIVPQGNLPNRLLVDQQACLYFSGISNDQVGVYGLRVYVCVKLINQPAPVCGELQDVINNLGGGLGFPLLGYPYRLEVCDPQNCNLNVTNIIINESISGAGDGNINISVSGNTPPYTYQWSNGATTQDIFNLSEGNYNVTITDQSGCTGQYSFNVLANSFLVWPGDANDDLIADNNDLLPIGLYYGISEIFRDSISNLWIGHTAYNWNDTIFNGANLTHVDCNGDGVINDADTLAINLNYGLTHVRSGGVQSRSGEPLIQLVPNQSSYLSGDTAIIDIVLGDVNNPVSNLYGMSFDLSFDYSLAETGSVQLLYPNSFLGNIANNLKLGKIAQNSGKVFGGIVKKNQQNANGYGTIAQLKFIAKNNTNSPINSSLAISNYFAITANADSVVFDAQNSNATFVIDAATGMTELSNELQFMVYPNPYTQSTTIQYSLKDASTTSLKIYDVLGRTIMQIEAKQEPKGTYQIPFTNKNGKGVYLVELNVNGYKTSKRIVEVE